MARQEAKPAGAYQRLLAAAGALLAPLLLLPRGPRRPCWLSGCTRPPGGLHQTCSGSAQAIMLTMSLDGRTGRAIAAATSEGSLPATLAVGQSHLLGGTYSNCPRQVKLSMTGVSRDI